MYEAKVVNIEKIAWNIERVHLKGEDFTMIIELNNPEDHGAYAVDEEVQISVKD
ncbi:MAG TPA: hypothetical protein VK589_30065 [Chryseolinea sp.]|nr:hypothetical protein [Chryseolinea sp.]